MPPFTSLHAALLLLSLVCAVQLYTCPYTKVEESFVLQAAHDLYYTGVGPAWQRAIHGNDSDAAAAIYDHWEYPGVVPRSFVGPAVLAALCQVTRLVLLPFGLDLNAHPMLVQALCRLWLLVLYVHAWGRLGWALNYHRDRRAHVGTYTLIITASQFHLTFYGSRTLPNVLATVVCLHAHAAWIRHHVPKAAVLLVITTAVLRCDVLLLLFTAGLVWLTTRTLTIVQALSIGINTGVVTLAVTVPLDSIMWQQAWMWPEGYVFYYNAILGKSENWGTSPWHWYATAALPKALLGTALLVPLGLVRVEQIMFSSSSSSTVVTRRQQQEWLFDTTLLGPAAAFGGFVALYSCLGHKEVRFLFPALPLPNAVAGAGLARLHQLAFCSDDYNNVAKKKKDDDAPDDNKPATGFSWSWLLRRGAYMAALGLLLLSFAASTAFVAVSRQNYPGGVALSLLAQRLQQQQSAAQCRIFIDNAAAMTGVSLFGQSTVPCTIVKAGYEDDKQGLPSLEDLTHLITEDARLANAHDNDFELLATIPGNPRLNWKRATIETSDVLYVLERKTLVA